MAIPKAMGFVDRWAMELIEASANAQSPEVRFAINALAKFCYDETEGMDQIKKFIQLIAEYRAGQK